MWGDNLGILEGLGFGEVSWEVRRRLEGEKVTVAEILWGGVGGFGSEDCDGEGEGVSGLGAKKREMTCCFCFPMQNDDGGGGGPWFGSFGGLEFRVIGEVTYGYGNDQFGALCLHIRPPVKENTENTEKYFYFFYV